MNCLLCQSEAVPEPFFESPLQRFLYCANCGTIFRDPFTFLTPEAEKERYLKYNNNPEDPRYQDFVSPIVKAVTQDFKSASKGLDYGAGTGPVIASLLREQGFEIVLYDPFFHPNAAAIKQAYDFVVACEVIEHFHHPLDEFKKLFDLLRPKGKLYCMTDPLDSSDDFAQWYYKDDPSHVLFYNKVNLEWICQQVGFSTLTIYGRLIIFER